jgi:hypothetical protein
MHRIYKILLNIVVFFLTSFCGFASDTQDSPPDGYLRKTSYSHNLREEFSKDFDGFYATEQVAFDYVWTLYDRWFDDNVVKIVLLGIKDFGVQMTASERDRLPYFLNRDRDIIDRKSAEVTIPYSISNSNEGYFINLKKAVRSI